MPHPAETSPTAYPSPHEGWEALAAPFSVLTSPQCVNARPDPSFFLRYFAPARSFNRSYHGANLVILNDLPSNLLLGSDTALDLPIFAHDYS